MTSFGKEKLAVVNNVDLRDSSVITPPIMKSKNTSVITSLCAGACAGAVAKTVIAPLDRTKIIFQVSKSPFSYKEAVNFLYRSYKNHGLFSWWRGNSATLARVIPYAAIQFTAHEQLKIKFGSINQEALPPAKRFMAGSLAGVTAAFFTYPLDLIRARLAVARRSKYRNLNHTIVSIYRQEGVKTFYNGFIPTIFGIMPYAGTSFFIYESLKQRYHTKYPDSELKAPYRLCYGAVAGMCGQFFSYPLDIVRRRMQTDGIDGKGYKYRKLIWTLKYVLRTEGVVKGFYKGMSVNWIKGPIAVGVSFMTFDTVKYFLDIFTESSEVHSF